MLPNRGSMTAGKTPHTLQNTGMALPDTFIIVLGRPFRGPNHDSRRLQQSWPPALDWCAALNGRVDRGSLGMKADYRGAQSALPTQKPRKRHKHPNPHVRDEQKAAKKAVSHIRIFIEQA